MPAEDNGDDGDVLVVVTMRKKMTMASVMRPAMVVMMWNLFGFMPFATIPRPCVMYVCTAMVRMRCT